MKKRLLSIVLTLAMIMSLFAGMGITASAAGSFIDITREANLTVTNKIANSYYVQGLREYHEQKDTNNYTKFFGQWAWVLSESDARAKLNELMRSPSSMDSQPSTLSVSSPNNEPANFLLNGQKADTLLIWAKAHPLSVNEGSYYYAILPMPKEITFTTNLNSSYSISSVDSKTLTVEATCADYDGALTYQWYYCGTRNNKANATAIEGATSNSCTVKPATAKESHYYFCRVTAGEVVGDSVVAGVYASDPYVCINNTEKIYATCYAVTGKPYTMKITNTTNNVVSGELCYQWYRCTDSEGTGAEAIEGATTDSFDVPTGTKGTYYYFGKAYIKLNGSEICSDQTQVAKVIVRDAHKITPVGTPGEDGYTIVEGGKFYFTGYSLQDDLTCPTNETCKLTYEPDDGYTVDKILVYKTGEPETTVDLEEWDSDTKQFTMPDFDITVEVTFKKLESIEKVDLTVDWSRVPSVNVGDNVLNVRFNEYYDWAVFVDGAGAVNGPVEMTIFTVKVTESNKKEICDAIVASGFNGLTPDDLTDMLEMLGCGAWLHPEFLFGINGYVVKENDVLAIMPFVNPYSGYFPFVGNAEIGGVYNGTVTCNGETVSDNAVFAQYGMSMLFPFIEVGTVSDLAEKKNAAETDVFDVFYNDDYGYTTGGSYGVMPGIVKAGETVTIRVNPDEGYEVDAVTWQPFVMPSDEGDDVNVVTLVDGKYTFTVPVDNAQDIMVKVTFKATATEPDDDGPYVITLDTTGVINGAAGVLFYNADNTEGEDDYYLMPSPGETDSIELEFNTDSADVVVAAGEGYAFETPPVVTLATGDNTTTLNGEFEGGIYFYNIAGFTGDSTITVVGEAVAVGGGEGGEQNPDAGLGKIVDISDKIVRNGNTVTITNNSGYYMYDVVAASEIEQDFEAIVANTIGQYVLKLFEYDYDIGEYIYPYTDEQVLAFADKYMVKYSFDGVQSSNRTIDLTQYDLTGGYYVRVFAVDVYNRLDVNNKEYDAVTGIGYLYIDGDEGDEGGDEGETIENLGEDIIKIEDGNVVIDETSENYDEEAEYFLMGLPASVLSILQMDADEFISNELLPVGESIVDVTALDLATDYDAFIAHATARTVMILNADWTNDPIPVTEDTVVVIYKVKNTNKAYHDFGSAEANPYFDTEENPGITGSVYAYALYGVYATLLEAPDSGDEPDGGDIVEGNVADISDWVSRSGDTVTINVPDGEKYMLGIIKHAEDEWNNAEYCEEVFGSFIGKTILTPENFEDQMYNYGNECYVELDGSGYFRELFTYAGIEEILTGNGEPIVLQLTEDQSIFLFQVSNYTVFQAGGGYKVYAILGAHAAEYLCDSNVPSDPAINISDDLGLTVVGNTYTVDAGEYQLADGHSWAYVIDGADPLSDYLWSPSGIGEVPSGTYDASSWNKLDANNSCTYENATQWDVILCCDVDENGRVVAWAWLPLADAEPGEPEQPTAEFDSVEVSFTHANSIGAIVPGEALPDLSSLASSVVVKDTNGNILTLNNEDGIQLGWLCKNPDSDEGWVWANDVAEEGVVYGIRVYVQNDGSYTFNDATTDDITLSDNNLTVDSAWTNSDPAFEFGFILTVSAHQHSYTYTSNDNGTHNGACECGEDAIVNEACTYVSGKCEKCGYSKPVTPPVLPPVHTHSYTYTSNDNGTHNGACVCGEDAIVNEACTYVGGKCEKCEYSEPVTPPTPPTVNVPVSNNENKVDVEAEISGNDATIKPLDEEQIDKLVGSENASGDVVIDLSKLDENIDTAGIPKATLEAVVNAAEDAGNNTEHLVIKLSTAELKFDDTAIRAIVDQANGDVLKFNFDDVGFDRLNATQKDAIKDMDVRKGYEAYITVNDQRIGDFKGGEVEIIVPYAVTEGEDVASFSVWYVDDDGTLEKQQSTYDGKEKCFIVTHFSDYVIVYSAEEVHNFAGDWKQDANEHWNECECGEDANRAAHADENNDGKCDVCDYQMATIIPEDTDDETSENLETSDTTNSDNDSTSDTEGGCRGGISIILIIVIILICVVIYIIFKKRDQDKNKAEKAK